ncbi:MAG: ClpXP protease specificity-enhancing factor SspB, partial [Holosporaceae bacterium]|nr:ClpXP protease specificity-enhancing factor SspB [Holosporaceae bacterium]
MNGFKYDELVQKALVSVVKEVLNEAAANGLPGNHHFYV